MCVCVCLCVDTLDPMFCLLHYAAVFIPFQLHSKSAPLARVGGVYTFSILTHKLYTSGFLLKLVRKILLLPVFTSGAVKKKKIKTKKLRGGLAKEVLNFVVEHGLNV